MNEATKISPGLNFTYITYSSGHFITGIDGLEQDTTQNLYWLFSVNGKESPVGVDQALLNLEDSITWNYEKASKDKF